MVPNNTEEFLIFKIIKFLLDDDDDDNDDDDNDNEISDRRKYFSEMVHHRKSPTCGEQDLNLRRT